MTNTEFAAAMRTYQARFDVNHSLRILRCLPPGERVADDRYAAMRFQDSIQLLRMVRQAGLPDEIVHGEAKRTTCTVTFQQLTVLGYSDAQLKELDIFPDE